MTRHERLYRRLLSIYPASFRDRYEQEMVTLFTDQLRDARSSGRPMQIVRLWLRSLGDLVSTAPGQHMAKEQLVPRPLDGAALALLGDPDRGGLKRTGYALALLPLWVGIVLRIAAPGFLDPLFLNPPAIVGLPAGIVVIFAAGLLMALGVLVMRSTRSIAWRTAAFALLTLPALALVVFAPAVILILANLPV
jgi:hypothetical protein